MNLTDFEEQQNQARKSRCMTCNLDPKVLEQIEDARHRSQPVPFKLISRWLKEDQSQDLLPATLRNHFVAGHDRD